MINFNQRHRKNVRQSQLFPSRKVPQICFHIDNEKNMANNQFGLACVHNSLKPKPWNSSHSSLKILNNKPSSQFAFSLRFIKRNAATAAPPLAKLFFAGNKS